MAAVALVGMTFPFLFRLSGAETRQFAWRRFAEQVPQPFVLDVQDEMETGQLRDDVAVLLIEMGERGIVTEDVYALPLRENHANRAVLENQAGFAIEKNGHLLIEQSLDPTYAHSI